MSKRLLSQLLGIAAALDYESGNIFGLPKDGPLAMPKGSIPSDKQKCQPKEQHEFTIKGVKIMAASRKDAIKKYKHLKGK